MLPILINYWLPRSKYLKRKNKPSLEVLKKLCEINLILRFEKVIFYTAHQTQEMVFQCKIYNWNICIFRVIHRNSFVPSIMCMRVGGNHQHHEIIHAMQVIFACINDLKYSCELCRLTWIV